MFIHTDICDIYKEFKAQEVSRGHLTQDWPNLAADHPDLDIRILESAYGRAAETLGSGR